MPRPVQSQVVQQQPPQGGGLDPKAIVGFAMNAAMQNWPGAMASLGIPGMEGLLGGDQQQPTITSGSEQSQPKQTKQEQPPPQESMPLPVPVGGPNPYAVPPGWQMPPQQEPQYQQQPVGYNPDQGFSYGQMPMNYGFHQPNPDFYWNRPFWQQGGQ